MVAVQITTEQIWDWLEHIPDPEIPVLSIVDLGIVRDVQWRNRELTIVITPTYSGCPAIDAIAADIRETLGRHGLANVALETQLSPPWTTDWLNDEAKSRLREYGIAPPARRAIDVSRIEPVRTPKSEGVACPRCSSTHTQLVSRFGSTPCKALYQCLDCLEPFDAFKQH
jgi:ring-1,2-phenylacetyl-CoA epoxidase subunit PaaD